MPDHDVFISYSSTQRDVAVAIGGALEGAGITYWLDQKDIRGGGAYGAKIAEAIKAARVFVLVFSDAAQRSTHVLNEVSIAVDSSAVTIPFRTDRSAPNDDIDYSLHRFNWVDAAMVPFEDGLAKLVSDVQAVLRGTAPQTRSEAQDPTPELPLTEEWLSDGREVIITLDQDSPSAGPVRRWLLACRLASKYAVSSWKLTAEDYEKAKEELRGLLQ